MTSDQAILFALLFFVFVFLIWGRWRYDLVAFAALTIAVIAGVVPADAAFSGFGHPATVIVALVLIVSRALSNSGVVEWIARHATSASRGLTGHIGIMAAIAAGLSAVMNNVAALAMLMPVDIQAAKKAGRSPALTLMPLSFASILGGMMTLIGTPPNIIVSQYRETALGEPYHMFDYAPVGVVCAAIGVLFVTLVGWRLIPRARIEHDSGKELLDIGDYVAEVEVPEDSPAIGKRVRDFDETAEENEVSILGVVRSGRRMPGTARAVELRAKDILVIEADPAAIEKLIGALKLEYVRHQSPADTLTVGNQDLGLAEVVVPENARIANRSAMDLRLLARHDVTLLGVSRQGRRFRERVRKLAIRPGDILLLLGPVDRLPQVISWLGCLPLAERGITVQRRDKALVTIGIFAVAILTASLGFLDLAVALGAAVVLLVGLNVVPLRELYESVEWPVVVLLGSLIPVGAALETTGSTSLIASGILSLSEGFSPVVILIVLMAITMSLSDVMNNTATAVIAAPIAVEIATRLGVNADPFLMSVAVASSCAFLTPIGHKNNTLILGPGGYRFSDYWRMGLPLEALVIAVGVPVILLVWPM
jgi:di/tricarboxylate transporter